MFGVTPLLPIRFTCYEKCFKGNDEAPDHRVTLQGKALAYYVPLELQPINQSNSFNNNNKKPDKSSSLQFQRLFTLDQGLLTDYDENENVMTKKLIHLSLMDTSTP